MESERSLNLSVEFDERRAAVEVAEDKLGASWFLGETLKRIRDELAETGEAGGFGFFLGERGMSDRDARRHIQIFEAYAIDGMIDFNSVRAAAEAALPFLVVQKEFQKNWDEFQTFGRRTVEAAWRVGGDFAEVKRMLGHGQWMPWLERKGIVSRTAQLLMQLHDGHEMRKLCAFESVAAAIKALPKPERETPLPTAKSVSEDRSTSAEEEPTKTSEASLEETKPTLEQTLKEEIDLYQQRAEDAEAQMEVLHERLAIATDGGEDPELDAVKREQKRVSEARDDNERLRKTVDFQNRRHNKIKQALRGEMTKDEILKKFFGVTDED